MSVKKDLKYFRQVAAYLEDGLTPDSPPQVAAKIYGATVPFIDKYNFLQRLLAAVPFSRGDEEAFFIKAAIDLTGGNTQMVRYQMKELDVTFEQLRYHPDEIAESSKVFKEHAREMEALEQQYAPQFWLERLRSSVKNTGSRSPN